MARTPLIVGNWKMNLNHMEVDNQWIKADGSRIDVWITATAVLDAEGKFLRSRSIAQDVTAHKA